MQRRLVAERLFLGSQLDCTCEVILWRSDGSIARQRCDSRCVLESVHPKLVLASRLNSINQTGNHGVLRIQFYQYLKQAGILSNLRCDSACRIGNGSQSECLWRQNSKSSIFASQPNPGRCQMTASFGIEEFDSIRES